MILLVVIGLLAGSAVAIAAKPTRLGLDLKGGVELIYQAKPTAQSKVDTESLERAINIMRSRVDKIGVSQPEIQRSGKDEIDVALPGEHNVKHAEETVGTTAQLNFYDWENNVIGPSGKPEPSVRTVTGDATTGGAGGSTAGLTQYQAVLRASKRPPRAARERHHLDPGMHARTEGRLYLRHLVPARHRPRRGGAGARRNRRQPVRRSQARTAALQES